MEDEDYDIGTLLGGPVRAIQEAQIAAEREYMQFLLDYGLEETTRKEDGKEVPDLKLREISFGMTRAISNPAAPGEVVETQARVRAPLLSLVQMPAIGIEEATIELDLDVRSETEAEEKAPAPAAGDRPVIAREALLPKSRVVTTARLKGNVSNATTTRNFRTHGKLNVKMVLRAAHDDDLHGRLARLAGDAVSTLADVPE
ncbi:DUF2589 domain-containing protein [Aliishimia ponticola]|uniref:DUF2589 domain-containing protein n=1 Tax=Aliishimia ponticola TaxID=2499833 RepID=A0A4S4ND11_9RHOB|nr:DUF2589 domain-containing protein [Aliishimia ponticola]THH37356.1 DUF2589 domain-containing protein [Aliishimia ponticola]